MIAKTLCQQCAKTIEFEAEQAGQFVSCPHCQQQTRLIVTNEPRTYPKPDGYREFRLISCRDCGNQISKEAVFCPHCGLFYQVSTRMMMNILGTIALATFILGLIGLVFGLIFNSLIK